MYSGEPMRSPVAVSWVEPCSAAMPKSVRTALPSAPQQDVGRLDVAVLDARRVRGAQGREQLAADAGGLAGRQRALRSDGPGAVCPAAAP